MPATDQALGKDASAPEATDVAFSTLTMAYSLPTRGNPRRRRGRITPNEIWWMWAPNPKASSPAASSTASMRPLAKSFERRPKKSCIYVMDPRDRNGTSCFLLTRPRGAGLA